MGKDIDPVCVYVGTKEEIRRSKMLCFFTGISHECKYYRYVDESLRR